MFYNWRGSSSRTKTRPASTVVGIDLHAKLSDDPASWAAEHHDPLRALVLERGCVLVRGLGLSDPAATEAVFRRLTSGRSARPRALRAAAQLRGRACTRRPSGRRTSRCACTTRSATAWSSRPVLFACLEAPATWGRDRARRRVGGAAGPCPRELVSRFSAGLDARPVRTTRRSARPVEEAFGTDDRAAVERLLPPAYAIEFAWQSDGSLYTRQRRGAVLPAPDRPLPSAGSTRSRSSTSGPWSRSVRAPGGHVRRRRGCPSTPVSATAIRSTRTSCGRSTRVTTP